MTDWNTVLATAYVGDDQHTPDRRIDDALHIPTAVHELLDEIVADMTRDVPGVKWWCVEGQWEHAALTADYLYSSVDAVRRALVDAALHHHEAESALATEEEKWNRAGRTNDWRAPGIPRSLSPREDLATRMFDIHVAGFFRAIATALDCLASAAIGVAAIDRPIQEAAWSIVIDQLSARAQRPHRKSRTRGDRELQVFAAKFVQIVADSGPPSWIAWTLETRHLLVHRASRRRLWEVAPFNRRILSAAATTDVRLLPHLWSQPLLSDAESLACGSGATDGVLNEPTLVSVAQVRRAATALAGHLMSTMAELWRWRRDHPDAVVQPVDAQWEVIRKRATRFNGFFPEHPPPQGNTIVAARDTGARFQAAVLDGERRQAWRPFAARKQRR